MLRSALRSGIITVSELRENQLKVELMLASPSIIQRRLLPGAGSANKPMIKYSARHTLVQEIIPLHQVKQNLAQLACKHKSRAYTGLENHPVILTIHQILQHILPISRCPQPKPDHKVIPYHNHKKQIVNRKFNSVCKLGACRLFIFEISRINL
jgi:hypothetical protein